MGETTLLTYIVAIPKFLTERIIPFILAVAFLVVVVNVIRYFVIKGHEEEGQKAGRDQVLYSIFAFVFIIIFWGVIALVASSVSTLTGTSPICPDYLSSEYCTTDFRGNRAPAGPPVTGNQTNY
jgi:dipeptide/tripeptide permease